MFVVLVDDSNKSLEETSSTFYGDELKSFVVLINTAREEFLNDDVVVVRILRESVVEDNSSSTCNVRVVKVAMLLCAHIHYKSASIRICTSGEMLEQVGKFGKRSFDSGASANCVRSKSSKNVKVMQKAKPLKTGVFDVLVMSSSFFHVSSTFLSRVFVKTKVRSVNQLQENAQNTPI